MKPSFRMFRWRAVGPLLFFLAVFVVLWILLADSFARRQAAAGLSDLLGTQVDIASLRIRESDAAVDIGGLAIADPRDPERNLFEAGTITFDLDPAALAEKKVVIDRLNLSGLRFLTQRATPARPADPKSPAASLVRETSQWAKDKFDIPSLALGRLDSVRGLALDPRQLGTIQAATAFTGRVDSVQGAMRQAFDRLALGPLTDSATALADQLSKTDPRTLGLAGIQTSATSVKRMLSKIDRAKKDLATVEQAGRSALGALEQGLADVEAARQRDYALARSLLKVPGLDAPEIGAALFGTSSLDYFQQALVYARLAQRYVPPGLQPWNRPGPKRARLAGQTVEFPKEREYPRFLLREGHVDLATGEANSFAATFGGITSQPALYGRPATLTASGNLGGDHPVAIELGGLSRHFGSTPKDSLVARLRGVELPAFDLPGLPFRLVPGRGALGLAFTLAGDRLAGVWDVSADAASWTADTARLARGSLLETTVWRVVSGLSTLRVRAEISGTLERPVLQVRSNLDDAIAGRLRALLGEAVARAEEQARAEVDRLVGTQVSALRGRMDGLRTEALARLPVERAQLDGAERRLEKELKRLTGTATGGLQLPKL